MEDQALQYEKQEELYERLAAYSKTDYYPFHMPGHKRADLNFANPYQIDLTEIDGFDDLHHAQGILLRSQKRLEKLYHSKKSYYLVNGSTCGILSAIGALVNPGDRVIIARNCHKSVYNAVKIFGLKTDYVYPQVMKCGLQGKVLPNDVESVLKKHPETKLIVITSPTYDGIVSDIAEIAGISRKYHVYFIVDEAHGAHFSVSRFFPRSAVCKGADIVIQSLHKTLPCFTQTAVLHVANERIDCSKVEEMLSIFQSSSPSYLLMAGIDRCVGMLERSGKQLFEQYYERLLHFYQSCEKLKFLYILTEKDYENYDVPAVDQSKIIIYTGNASINGAQLYDRLLEQYHLQMEMYSAQYVLAMTSIMDTRDGFDRLFQALLEIDCELAEKQKNSKETDTISKTEDTILDAMENTGSYAEEFLKEMYAVREKVMEISDAAYYNIEETSLANSVGKVCGEYIYLYPPGIPMIVPGELITDPFIRILQECSRIGLRIQGMKDKQHRKILTIAYDRKNKL